MKKIILLLAIVSVLCSSCETIRSKPTVISFREFPRPALSIYEIAEQKTGCPAYIVRGLHFAESSYGENTNHPCPFDRGEFGINERYHAERAEKWGEYNPDNALQSAILAGNIIMENLAALGSYDLAVCAYRQGVTGVQRNGADLWYADRVMNAPVV